MTEEEYFATHYDVQVLKNGKWIIEDRDLEMNLTAKEASELMECYQKESPHEEFRMIPTAWEPVRFELYSTLLILILTVMLSCSYKPVHGPKINGNQMHEKLNNMDSVKRATIFFYEIKRKG